MATSALSFGQLDELPTAEYSPQIQAELAQVTEKIIEQGTDWSSPVAALTAAWYKPLLDRYHQSVKGKIEVHTNISYGPESRNVLDVYVHPGKAKGDRPVLIWFHGGAFVAGDKDLYTNLGYYFAQNGIISVLCNHQRATTFPAGAEDVQLAREWVYKNIGSEDFGFGDVNKVILAGQSAGGGHVGTNVFAAGDPSRPNRPDILSPPLAGTIFMSATLTLYHITNATVETIYGSSDPAVWYSRSTLGLMENLPATSPALDNRRLPTLLVIGQYDQPASSVAAIRFVTSYQNRSTPVSSLPEFHVLSNHNHISYIYSLGTEDEAPGKVFVDFIRRAVSRQY